MSFDDKQCLAECQVSTGIIATYSAGVVSGCLAGGVGGGGGGGGGMGGGGQGLCACMGGGGGQQWSFSSKAVAMANRVINFIEADKSACLLSRRLYYGLQFASGPNYYLWY